jgi:hypothetical protein
LSGFTTGKLSSVSVGSPVSAVSLVVIALLLDDGEADVGVYAVLAVVAGVDVLAEL